MPYFAGKILPILQLNANYWFQLLKYLRKLSVKGSFDALDRMTLHTDIDLLIFINNHH